MRIVTKQYVIMFISVIIWGIIYAALGIEGTLILLAITLIGYLIQVQVDKTKITDAMIQELISKMEQEELEKENKGGK